MARRSPLINVMVAALMKASRNLRRDFGEVEQLQVSKNGPTSFVQMARKKTEEVLVDELFRVRPDFGMLSDTVVSDPKRGDAKFIVGPLEGVTNFEHGLPHFSLTLAVEERGEIMAAVIYAPLNDELFWAERGQGAYVNDARLRVSGRVKMDDALLATSAPVNSPEGRATYMAEIAEFLPTVAGIRSFGTASLDLAYVAAGRLDACWLTAASPWSVAAGALLVREAGGYASNLKGGNNVIAAETVVAANDRLHAPVERALKRVHRNLA